MAYVKYLPSLIFIIASFVFAWYSHWSIKKNTNTWIWHLLQWGSIGLFLAGGFLSGFVFGVSAFSFRLLGQILGVAVIGIPVYVFTLHALNNR